MKGQSSMELFVTFGIVLAFTVPVIFLLLSTTSVGYEESAKAQADASSRSLADAMNIVYAQGAGAKKEILLNVPATTEEIYSQAGQVVVRIRTSGGVFDAASPTIADVVGSRQTIGKKTGLFRLIISATNRTGEVELIDPETSG